MNLNKRIEKLEAIAPPIEYKNLRELMDAETTQGTPEYEALSELYNPHRYDTRKKTIKD